MLPTDFHLPYCSEPFCIAGGSTVGADGITPLLALRPYSFSELRSAVRVRLPDRRHPSILQHFRRRHDRQFELQLVAGESGKAVSQTGCNFKRPIPFSKSFDQASSFEGELNPLRLQRYVLALTI